VFLSTGDISLSPLLSFDQSHAPLAPSTQIVKHSPTGRPGRDSSRGEAAPEQGRWRGGGEVWVAAGAGAAASAGPARRGGAAVAVGMMWLS
jgi:hypothetical protein